MIKNMTFDGFCKLFLVGSDVESFNKNKRMDKRCGRVASKNQLTKDIASLDLIERKLKLSMRLIMSTLQDKDQERYWSRYMKEIDR